MNLLQLPTELPAEEWVETLAAGQTGVRIERIVSTGQTSGWYNQQEAEFVAVLAGSATLEYRGGAQVHLGVGNALLLPPHCEHRVARTSSQPPCVWLCVFYPAAE